MAYVGPWSLLRRAALSKNDTAPTYRPSRRSRGLSSQECARRSTPKGHAHATRLLTRVSARNSALTFSTRFASRLAESFAYFRRPRFGSKSLRSESSDSLGWVLVVLVLPTLVSGARLVKSPPRSSGKRSRRTAPLSFLLLISYLRVEFHNS